MLSELSVDELFSESVKPGDKHVNSGRCFPWRFVMRCMHHGPKKGKQKPVLAAFQMTFDHLKYWYWRPVAVHDDAASEGCLRHCYL